MLVMLSAMHEIGGRLGAAADWLEPRMHEAMACGMHQLTHACIPAWLHSGAPIKVIIPLKHDGKSPFDKICLLSLALLLQKLPMWSPFPNRAGRIPFRVKACLKSSSGLFFSSSCTHCKDVPYIIMKHLPARCRQARHWWTCGLHSWEDSRWSLRTRDGRPVQRSLQRCYRVPSNRSPLCNPQTARTCRS